METDELDRLLELNRREWELKRFRYAVFHKPCGQPLVSEKNLELVCPKCGLRVVMAVAVDSSPPRDAIVTGKFYQFCFYIPQEEISRLELVQDRRRLSDYLKQLSEEKKKVQDEIKQLLLKLKGQRGSAK